METEHPARPTAVSHAVNSLARAWPRVPRWRSAPRFRRRPKAVWRRPRRARPAGQALAEIAEIAKTTANGPVQGVIKILNENKTYIGASKATPGTTAPQTGQMRYFAGSLPGGPDIWPPKNGSPAPGPTIRARVGDTVQITLLNQVDVAAFGDSLDAGEQTGSCDVSTASGSQRVRSTTIPAVRRSTTMPNCYHGSSTANLHYHGTHVSPNIIDDNVFVQLRPSPRIGRPSGGRRGVSEEE